MTVRLLSSDLPNRYGAILFASPAAIELEVLGALSDALVYCRRHEQYPVVEEKRLLTGAETEMGVHPERCCRTAVNRVYEAFESSRRQIETFGEGLYCYHKSNRPPPSESDDGLDPDDRGGYVLMALRNQML